MLAYQTVVLSVCPVCPVCDVGVLWQTVRRIKMKLGMRVGLDSGYIVLYGDPAPPPQRGADPLPQFSAHTCCSQMAGWIKMPLGIEVGLVPLPGDFVLDGGPCSPLPKKGRAAP